MSAGRRRRTLVIGPTIPDGASAALKDALAIRNAASASGRCACGARGQLSGPDRDGLLHLVFLHEHGCPATDESIRRLGGAVG